MIASGRAFSSFFNVQMSVFPQRLCACHSRDFHVRGYYTEKQPEGKNHPLCYPPAPSQVLGTVLSGRGAEKHLMGMKFSHAPDVHVCVCVCVHACVCTCVCVQHTFSILADKSQHKRAVCSAKSIFPLVCSLTWPSSKATPNFRMRQVKTEQCLLYTAMSVKDGDKFLSHPGGGGRI